MAGPGIDYTVEYDTLIVAAGASQSYFGNDEFADFAPGMKSIDDALELRARIFGAFEMADLQTDPEDIDRWLTFVVVGAGPTGTEMAGQIAELAHRNLPGQYQHIDPRQARIILVDALGAVLNTFGDHLSTRALRQLHLLGVEVELNTKVVGVDATGIEVETERGHERIPSMTKIWAAGVAAPAAGPQAGRGDRREDRPGRPDLGRAGPDRARPPGDLRARRHDEPRTTSTGGRCPGVAQVAIQGGRYAADADQAAGWPASQPGQPFKYFDKGSLATISRFSAVASIGRLRLSGFSAWLIWVAVHLFYLVGFKNRVTAVLHWAVSFLGRGRSERVATRAAGVRPAGDPRRTATRSSGSAGRPHPRRPRPPVPLPGRRRGQRLTAFGGGPRLTGRSAAGFRPGGCTVAGPCPADGASGRGRGPSSSCSPVSS